MGWIWDIWIRKTADRGGSQVGRSGERCEQGQSMGGDVESRSPVVFVSMRRSGKGRGGGVVNLSLSAWRGTGRGV